jgi:hypothetical protein
MFNKEIMLNDAINTNVTTDNIYSNILVSYADEYSCNYYDSLKRCETLPMFNWLLSMGIFRALPNDGKFYNLVEYLKTVRNNYNNVSVLQHIDYFIN